MRASRGILALAGVLLSSLSVPGQTYKAIESKPPRYDFLLYMPKNMWASKRKWPLILYLHGRSLRGDDLSRVTRYGLAKRLKTDRGFPFIVMCPQLPSGRRWTETDVLAGMVKHVSKWYPVDKSRVYVMGFSMGASGAWRVAHAHPHLFAAVVSIAGTYEKPLAETGRLRNVPIWVIHGTADKDASPAVAKEVLALHLKHGGKGKFTPLPGLDHNIPEIFDRSELYKWLYQYRQLGKLRAQGTRK